jgi:hypothetical protein
VGFVTEPEIDCRSAHNDTLGVAYFHWISLGAGAFSETHTTLKNGDWSEISLFYRAGEQFG